MTTISELADQHRCRANEMRTIARGIYDAEERKSLLDFIADSERLERAAKAKDHGVVLPINTITDAR